MDKILHTLGLNKHFPMALVHAGPESLGLGIDDMAMVQGITQLQLLLGHLNKTDCTGTLIIIALSYLELENGLGKCPFGHLHTTTLEHVTMTWITSIGHFLHRTGCQVETRTDRTAKQQRKNDGFIMHVALDENFNLKLIQQC